MKPTALLLLLGLGVSAVACSPTSETRAADALDAASATAAAAIDPARAPLTPAERQFYMEVAELAWAYMDANYQPATGLVNATPEYQYATTWDIGGQLLGFHSAKELGLLDHAEYDRRLRQTLLTLEHAELFRGLAYNKLYSTRNASMGAGPPPAGRGWSATDLGRLLIALKVISVRDPEHAAQAERIVHRISFGDVVKRGYTYGQLIGNSGRPWSFQEGRVGYEQYLATGFSLWGARVGNALNLRRNTQAVEVLGVRLLKDRREQDRLLSEPFILMELELGMPPDMRDLAAAVLAAQEARYETTGQITIVSEDAIGLAPYYFYYYCVYCNEKPFVVGVAALRGELDQPRWVSTKAAFGWHAIMPSEYTQKAMEYVEFARHPNRGWASGVFEGTHASTNTFDVNTAAVLLEIAYFQLRGGVPLIKEAPG